MTRDDITRSLLAIFAKQFEIENPDMDSDLREAYEFDSIDAIELLREIELMLGDPLTRDEKESAMTIRTFGQIVDYVEGLAKTRTQLGDAR